MLRTDRIHQHTAAVSRPTQKHWSRRHTNFDAISSSSFTYTYDVSAGFFSRLCPFLNGFYFYNNCPGNKYDNTKIIDFFSHANTYYMKYMPRVISERPEWKFTNFHTLATHKIFMHFSLYSFFVLATPYQTYSYQKFAIHTFLVFSITILINLICKKTILLHFNITAVCRIFPNFVDIRTNGTHTSEKMVAIFKFRYSSQRRQ